jgi:ABC-type spermidine/putrescine transport system permease subunit I
VNPDFLDLHRRLSHYSPGLSSSGSHWRTGSHVSWALPQRLLVLVIIPFLTGCLIRTYGWLAILAQRPVPLLGGSKPRPSLNTHFAVILRLTYGFSRSVLPLYA